MMDGTWTEFEKKNFDQKDDEYACLWTVSEGKIVNVETNSVTFDLTAQMSTGTSPVMVYTASNTTFNLYPVTITPNASAYDVLTFTYQTNAEYQRQFVTSERVGEVPATLSEEPEIPAEEVGGETGNNT